MGRWTMRMLDLRGAIGATDRLVIAAALVFAAVALTLPFAARNKGASPTAKVAAQQPPAAARWAFRPTSTKDMVARSEAIVVARVLSVERGPDLIPRTTTDDSGDGALPTQRIHLRLERVFRNANGWRLGGEVVLFRTGGTSDSGEALTLEGDPPYEAGERYALFLRTRRAADGTVVPVAPDGRLALDPADRLQPVIEGSVAEQLGGRHIGELGDVTGG